VREGSFQVNESLILRARVEEDFVIECAEPLVGDFQRQVGENGHDSPSLSSPPNTTRRAYSIDAHTSPKKLPQIPLFPFNPQKSLF
jgi:hypothetical protein